ncbi:MAG: hypothetical protein ABEJ73_02370 [Haloplanus sp.]
MGICPNCGERTDGEVGDNVKLGVSSELGEFGGTVSFRTLQITCEHCDVILGYGSGQLDMDNL